MVRMRVTRKWKKTKKNKLKKLKKWKKKTKKKWKKIDYENKQKIIKKMKNES